MIIKLTPQIKRNYRDFLQTATQKAWAYRGGETQLNAFYDPLKQAEQLIRSQGLSPTLDAERSFAAAAGIPDEDFQSFNDILQRATDAFNAAANLGAADLEAMLAFLEQGGAKVLHGENEPDFIPTADGRLKDPKHPNPELYKRIFQPRLLWLSQGLESIGVYADDLIIHVRHADPRKLRQTPYILVEIPRHRKQIILANQRGEITFVANDRFELSMWEQLNKYQLKTLPGLTPVILRDKDIWLNRILALIQSDDGIKRDKPKVNLDKDAQSPKRSTAPYSVALIIESLEASFAATGLWPSIETGLITYGPLANERRTWSSVNNSMWEIWRSKTPSSSCNGLNRDNCPYPSLSELKKKMGFKLSDYSIEDIKSSMQATYEASGEYPGLTSGIIMHGPLANGQRTWSSVDISMRHIWRDSKTYFSCNGLTQQNCPYESLEDLKTKLGWVGNYTLADIIDSVRASLKHTGNLPGRNSGIIEYGRLSNGTRTWVSVDGAMRAIWRENDRLPYCNGLTRENCNYTSLYDLKEKEGLISSYTVQDIINSLKLTYKITGHLPTRNSGIIEHGPLSDGERTWGSVDSAIRIIWREKNPLPSCNGLTRTNCPYRTLHQIAKADLNSLSAPLSAPQI